MSDDAELAVIIDRLRSGYDMLPFMTALYPAGGMRLRPMPAEMRALLEAAPDYRPLDPGGGPVWIQIASDNDAAELVVCRSRGTGALYVVVPDREA